MLKTSDRFLIHPNRNEICWPLTVLEGRKHGWVAQPDVFTYTKARNIQFFKWFSSKFWPLRWQNIWYVKCAHMYMAARTRSQLWTWDFDIVLPTHAFTSLWEHVFLLPVHLSHRCRHKQHWSNGCNSCCSPTGLIHQRSLMRMHCRSWETSCRWQADQSPVRIASSTWNWWQRRIWNAVLCQQTTGARLEVTEDIMISSLDAVWGLSKAKARVYSCCRGHSCDSNGISTPFLRKSLDQPPIELACGMAQAQDERHDDAGHPKPGTGFPAKRSKSRVSCFSTRMLSDGHILKRSGAYKMAFSMSLFKLQ